MSSPSSTTSPDEALALKANARAGLPRHTRLDGNFLVQRRYRVLAPRRPFVPTAECRGGRVARAAVASSAHPGE